MKYYGNNDWRDYHLAHYGVLGMKWGVRRYQNYDGSYTKRGLERYKDAEKKYQKAKEIKNDAKVAYRAGTGSKSSLKRAKGEQKIAKRKLSDSYYSLKRDKLADQGKMLYGQGKTITSNYQKAMYAQLGIMAVSKIAGLAAEKRGMTLTTKYGTYLVSELAPAAITAGGTAINLSLAAKNYYEAKRLRAYYAH